LEEGEKKMQFLVTWNCWKQ